MSNFLEASKELHKKNSSFGKASEYNTKGSMKHELTIPLAVAAAHQVQPIQHILDHGCGKGGLVNAINEDTSVPAKAYGYDPAVTEFSQLPDHPFDIITSIDVLEHVGRENIGETLKEIKTLDPAFFFFCIDLLPASKKTSDKRNAHFLVAPSDWWAQQIKSYFKIVTAIEVGEMPDQSNYPIHLFGCATNSIKNFDAMTTFLRNVRVANKNWIWNPTQGGATLR
ncbi:cyclopropane-fatty-acyl-phospholipid synthase family protein [Synechococcus sp. CC9616]|uniref:SAM-dependent methyltransferase n=1 Tax=Synechococcus sp. CC9616 TaxID=110663 RepID=UPI0012EC1007|nr:methyltransferase domain-containing protein [Synechococcus sp. CC9616]